MEFTLIHIGVAQYMPKATSYFRFSTYFFHVFRHSQLDWESIPGDVRAQKGFGYRACNLSLCANN